MSGNMSAIGVLFESKHATEIKDRCAERGCVYPAAPGLAVCAMHYKQASRPELFVRLGTGNDGAPEN